MENANDKFIYDKVIQNGSNYNFNIILPKLNKNEGIFYSFFDFYKFIQALELMR